VEFGRVPLLQQPDMKVTAAIGVINEAECIEQCVDYHASIGIDSFVIFDLGSTDGTEDILKRLATRKNVRVIYEDMLSVTRRDANQPTSPLPHLMQQAAYDLFHPDYIAYIDPDEFWLPASGKLQWEVYSKYDVLEVARYNVIPDAALAAGNWEIPNKNLQDRVVFRDRILLPFLSDLDHRAPYIRHLIGPKICHRAKSLTITLGNHSIMGSSPQTKLCPSDLVILHFPFSTFDRFQRKMRTAAAYINDNESRIQGGEAWHWRLWVHAARNGLLREAYESQFVADDEIQRLRQEGVVCCARELFTEPS